MVDNPGLKPIEPDGMGGRCICPHAWELRLAAPGRLQMLIYCAPTLASTRKLTKLLIVWGLRAKVKSPGTVRIDHAASITKLVWWIDGRRMLVDVLERYSAVWKMAKSGVPVPPDVQNERTVSAGDVLHTWARLSRKEETT